MALYVLRASSILPQQHRVPPPSSQGPAPLLPPSPFVSSPSQVRTPPSPTSHLRSSAKSAARRLRVLSSSSPGNSDPSQDSSKSRPSNSATSALGSKNTQAFATAAPVRESASPTNAPAPSTPAPHAPSPDAPDSRTRPPLRHVPAEVTNGPHWDLNYPSTSAEPLIESLQASARLASSYATEADRRWGELVEDGSVFRQQFLIRWCEVGQGRRASMECLANLLQESGSNHAGSVGFVKNGSCASPTMHRLNLVWVVTRMHVQMEQFPTWGDVVEVETYFQWESNISWRRDWVVRMPSEGNKVIGRGTSTWVMMNLKTRRLAKITDEIKSECIVHTPSTPKFCLEKETIPVIPKHTELQEEGEVSEEFVFQNLVARRSDLDMHQHVNNVTYVGWMMESMPQDLLDKAELVQITLEYKKECRADDVIESAAWELGERKSGPSPSHSEGSVALSGSNGVAHANGVPVNGVAVNGVAVNGFAVKGAAVNGSAINGVAVNGVALNGIPVNGIRFNGSPLNGVAVNGVSVNGDAVLGMASASGGTAVETVSGLQAQIRIYHVPDTVYSAHHRGAVPSATGHVGGDVGREGEGGKYRHWVHSLRLQGSAKDNDCGKEFCRGYTIWKERD